MKETTYTTLIDFLTKVIQMSIFGNTFVFVKPTSPVSFQSLTFTILTKSPCLNSLYLTGIETKSKLFALFFIISRIIIKTQYVTTHIKM